MAKVTITIEDPSEAHEDLDASIIDASISFDPPLSGQQLEGDLTDAQVCALRVLRFLKGGEDE